MAFALLRTTEFFLKSILPLRSISLPEYTSCDPYVGMRGARWGPFYTKDWSVHLHHFTQYSLRPSVCIPYCPRTFCPCSCSFFVTCIKYILDYSVRPICLPWTRKLLTHIFSDIIYMDSRCFGARLNLGPRNKTWLLVIVAIPPHLINWSTHWILKSPTHWILKSPTHWSPPPTESWSHPPTANDV
jgi:hypothetical protein